MALESTGAAGAATSAAAAGASVAALGAGAGIAAGMAMAVVMLLKKPRSEPEWLVAIISTLMSSFGGGAAVILHYGLLRWVQVPDPVEAFVGLMALIGVAFSCGLPGWAVVRWAFNWIMAREGKGLDEVARDAVATVKEIV